MKKILNFPLLILLLTVVFFFKPFLFENKLPIPADTIIGLYHPFRDLYAHDYPNGIPYKNFLITDPVRQQYPWRELAIANEKNAELPLWNPYSLGGTPLLGSLQAAALYPLNFFFFVLPFPIAWSLLIFLQPLLAGSFLYWYLKNLKLSSVASLIGGITFAFCGYSIAWLEWGTVLQVTLWLPLVLLSVDKIFHFFSEKRKGLIVWSFVFLFALSSSLLAGHLQLFFYVSVVSFFYLFARWLYKGRQKKIIVHFLLLALGFLILTFVQWFPTIQFIGQSARGVDQLNWQIEGWFIPWQHLVQFIAPDFFGNPTTLNYWGVWNYGELVGYVGIIPLIFALFALFFRRDKKTLFFGALFFLSLIFALPTIFAKLPYLLQIPFLSTSQPTRLLMVTDFSLAILAAFGLDWFVKQKNKKYILFPLGFLGFVLGCLWVYVFQNTGETIVTAKRNLYLPTVLFLFSATIIFVTVFIKNKKLQFILTSLLVLITLFDLLRFGQKFIPFTDKAYLFPSTKIISFLQKDEEQFRIMATDSRIIPPNFSAMYRLQNVGGYDPLYLKRYGELIAASERGKPDIQPPFGFNRIIAPSNINSRIMDLMGVKYVLSFTELPPPKFTKVAEEGMTKVYKNNDAYPRAFFVAKVKEVSNNQEAINALFDPIIDLRKTAIASVPVGSSGFGQGKATVSYYSENVVVVNTENQSTGFLILTDSYYPTWKAKVCLEDKSNCTELPIFVTDYNFRGIIIPTGKHSIVFYNTLL